MIRILEEDGEQIKELYEVDLNKNLAFAYHEMSQYTRTSLTSRISWFFHSLFSFMMAGATEPFPLLK
ncbi:hypothetical protein ACIQYG_05525 [Peribacillus sp. NPDC096622]|uniref:hypothetical protein n=1 Tax=Peribacillus sp. NPDC096622 TaxID=3364396 RepID=UPI003819C1F6